MPRSALRQQGCVAECLPAPQILKSVKAASEVRNSVSHSAIIFANALMHCGTTVDSFLRDNLDWLSRATNWAKFSATAGLGVIHRGHLAEVCLLRLQPQPRHLHVHASLSDVVWMKTGLVSLICMLRAEVVSLAGCFGHGAGIAQHCRLCNSVPES